MGVLQVHLSGGEPASRRDLTEIVGAASQAGLYTNLITSAIGLDAGRLERLRDAGLDHVQVSIQDTDPVTADRIAGYEGAHARKQAFAGAATALGLALTVNVVIHRANIGHLPELVAFAVSLGAGRVEIAHAQYYGWALRNRDALMPAREQVNRAMADLDRLRDGRVTIDFVVPDYYASRPKPCMGGWGRRSLNVTPSGLVLPCHAAQTIPGLTFWSVRDRSLADIWAHSPAFAAFRGTDWMQEPCRSCDLREQDFGGCRCQALAIAGDAAAADPSCDLSPHHQRLIALAEEASGRLGTPYVYRGRPAAYSYQQKE
jgi:pyrroloquinoline quinone biosynthesis protein E